jgi:P pilus assembly chaperone PapD
MKKKILLVIASMLLAAIPASHLFAQAGITAKPSRLYFSGPTPKSQKIVVNNPSGKPLEVGVTVSDWQYDSLGNNEVLDSKKLPTSAATSIKVLPGSYFTLKANESKEVTIQYSPSGNMDAGFQTGMIFFTQLNPGAATNNKGALIKVTVRVGVKVYYTPNSADEVPTMAIENLQDVTVQNKKNLQLTMKNSGRIWADGRCRWELLNTGNGKKTKLPDQDFYTLPGDRRQLRTELPTDLAKGKYTATAVITYGKTKEVKAAELEFEL